MSAERLAGGYRSAVTEVPPPLRIHRLQKRRIRRQPPLRHRGCSWQPPEARSPRARPQRRPRRPSLLGRHQRLQTGTPPLRLPTHRPPIVRGRWFRSRGFGRRALIRGRLHANIQRDLVRFARVESRRRHVRREIPVLRLRRVSREVEQELIRRFEALHSLHLDFKKRKNKNKNKNKNKT